MRSNKRVSPSPARAVTPNYSIKAPMDRKASWRSHICVLVNKKGGSNCYILTTNLNLKTVFSHLILLRTEFLLVSKLRKRATWIALHAILLWRLRTLSDPYM